MTGPDQKINPHLVIVLAILAISFSSIFTRLASAPPMVIAFYRLGFTALLTLACTLSNADRRQLVTISGRDLVAALLAGIFLALHFTVWITSLNYTTISSSTVLVTMQPLFVVSFAYLLFKERIGRPGLAGGALALTGSVLVGAGDLRFGGTAFYGDLLAFSGAFFVAIYFLIGRSLRERLSLFPYTLLVYSSGAIFLLIFNLVIVRQSLYPYPVDTWLWLVALALIPTMGGHTVYNWALRYVKAAEVSVSTLGEPVGATILAYFIFGEAPGVIQLIGGLVIICGVALFIYSQQRRERE